MAPEPDGTTYTSTSRLPAVENDDSAKVSSLAGDAWVMVEAGPGNQDLLEDFLWKKRRWQGPLSFGPKPKVLAEVLECTVGRSPTTGSPPLGEGDARRSSGARGCGAVRGLERSSMREGAGRGLE